MKGNYTLGFTRSLSVPLVLSLLVFFLASATPVESLLATSPTPFGGRFPDGPPAYDTGWQTIGQGRHHYVYHYLGGDRDDYVVDLTFMSSEGAAHHRGFRRDRVGYLEPWEGAFWGNLTSTRIEVFREDEDLGVDQYRLRIWVAPPADYDSGWVDVDAASSVTFDHDLGGSTDDYLVYLESRSDGAWGLHQLGYGLDYHPPPQTGAYCYDGFGWEHLTASSISVRRGGCDLYADRIRVRIWRVPRHSMTVGGYLSLRTRRWSSTTDGAARITTSSWICTFRAPMASVRPATAWTSSPLSMTESIHRGQPGRA